MKWLTAKSVQDLKSIGSFNLVRKKIKSDLGERLKIPSQNWDDLYLSVKSLREFVNKSSDLLNKNPESNNNEEITSLRELLIGKDNIKLLPYFKSKTDQIIFCLLELDGQARQDKLGITNFHFKNKEFAKQWRNQLIHQLHPDVCSHPEAVEASIEVNKLFERMTATHEQRQR